MSSRSRPAPIRSGRIGWITSGTSRRPPSGRPRDLRRSTISRVVTLGRRGERAIRRILHCTRFYYFESSNGAATASRVMLECLARHGFEVEALCGSIVDSGVEDDPADLMVALGLAIDAGTGPGRLRTDAPHLRTRSGGVRVTVHRRTSRRFDLPGDRETSEFLALFEEALDRFRPEILVTYGGDALTVDLIARARDRGVATVFALHNFAYSSPRPFERTDAVFVPSRFAADYYLAALGVECTVLPNLVDLKRVRAERTKAEYVTFINPSPEKGVFPFARIADELGRRRPDIPLLVVESRGSEGTLVSCGLDLRPHGNVFLMAETHDPREFWGRTRLCLLPSLWWENQPLVAVEAIVNGIPVIGSDRGGIPEALGSAGVVLPLPDRLTPVTRGLPDAEEVRPWVEAVIRLWDDREAYEAQRRLAIREAERWRPEVLEPRHVDFFKGIRPGASPVGRGRERRGDWSVLVPIVDDVAPETDVILRQLESEGIRVLRARADLGLGVARSRLLSQAMDEGSRSMLLVDARIAFDPYAAMRCLARPEPIITAGRLDGHAPGIYPIPQIGAGFLRVRAEVLERMIQSLDLAPMRDRSGQRFWHFFREGDAAREDGSPSDYLDPGAAFSERLNRLGVTPMADTALQFSIRPAFTRGRGGIAANVWETAASSWEHVPGFFDYHHAYAAAVNEAPDPAVFVEVGTLVGRSTCFLGEEIRRSGKAITLYAIDTCRGSPTDSTGTQIAPSVGGTYAGALHRNILGCGLEVIVVPILTESVRAARLFPFGGVDFCFIDGDHSYESVTADLSAWWPKIKPGGLIAGHDYRQSAPWLVDVTRAVHDFFGVEEAMHPLVSSCWLMRKPEIT
ncbi:MAG: class I SAM-dependent methyltransferase [Paludisphaera borealis]|uniref:class I SAM-dependent methyltransferase n=1 Tax=Paludisphaera borealis TaxID=1387353 RepID=UPI0028509B25|nr:class I SAM-dependent methyltransferase [Paludisphaera borealis]MDR3618425.1 class I SAM-dependent methyltransferase [Paludisphaera borealis]